MKCLICNSSSLHFLLNPFRGSSIYRCDSCTNAITIPAPEDKYEENRFYQKGEEDVQAYTAYSGLILDYIKNVKPEGNLLDIGCGAGYLLEEAGKAGYRAQGVDISKGAIAFCKKRRLNVRQGYFGRIKFPENYFDILVASHVVEH